MSESAPLVIQIQMEAIDPNSSVTNLLRKVKLATTKLGINSASEWVDSEINGYKNIRPLDLPEYRQTYGRLHFHHPNYGWRPIVISSGEYADIIQKVFIFDPISTIEDNVKSMESGDSVGYNVMERAKEYVYKNVNFGFGVGTELGYMFDLILKVQRPSLINVLEANRNLILEWSAKLESEGVLGEGFSFSSREKERAHTVTKQVFSGNIGVFGNVSDNAKVSNIQTVTHELDISKIYDVINQISGAINLLPDTNRRVAEPLIENVKEEMAGKSPDHSRIRTLLSSIRAACEGASGNLAAEGIMALIKGVLG
ncbi:hypothetical protein [Azospirillum sp. TSA6c]|uniref:AbiTii domain-containing protein n=1 Tax=Azospirillum sp. TSA6c TaxID=709813 RepID=UPI0011B531DB|nr:hypothetical protein [Azospirillum sp. TSA6c]